GFYENIPRMLPDGISAKIKQGSFPVPPIFELIQKEGNITEHDMYNTFNMGIGMAIVVDRENAEKAVEILRSTGEDAFVIGSTVEGTVGVLFNY
ncbi:MAG: AIR synthase-related protein, partial [[Eubacterium] saphenum]|nr:AIR synthase-related protein [[Eubacterium] saphenum]